MEQPNPPAGNVAAGSVTLRIDQSRALSYRVPKERSGKQHLNFVVEVRGSTNQHPELIGLGEGQPRGKRTGDDPKRSWKFLEAAVSRLHDREIVIEDSGAGLDAVRQIMKEISALTDDFTRDGQSRRNFRGTLLGIEVALLNLVSRALGVTVADLLGRHRDRAPLSPPLVALRDKPASLRRKLKKHYAEYEHVRLTYPTNSSRASGLLNDFSDYRESQSRRAAAKPLWIECNAGLDWVQCEQLFGEIISRIEANELPTQVTIEQPLRAATADDLDRLQQLADEQVKNSNTPGAQVTIMADGPVWDLSDYEDLAGTPALRAVNIRPAKAGGLLASLDLAESLVATHPDAVIGVTRMLGASRISTAAIRHLALALPKVDGVLLAPSVEKQLDITELVTAANLPSESRVQRSREPLAASKTHLEELERGDREFRRQQTITLDREVIDEHETQDNIEDPDEEPEGSGPSAQRGEKSSPNAADEGSTTTRDLETSGQAGFFETGNRAAGVEPVPGLGVRLLYADLINSTLDFATFPEPAPLTFEGKSANVYDDVDYIRPIGSYAVHGHIVEREALAHGLNTQRFHKRKFLVSDGKKRPLPFQTSRWPLSSVTASALARHKEAVRIRLARFGCPVPRGRTFSADDLQTAVQYAERIGFPAVLKPAEGSMGIGVTANIQSPDELREAYDLLQQSQLAGTEFIVEQHIHGNDYRIMIIGEEVISAVQRLPAFVVGDGKSTVAELILQKNAIKRENPHLGPLKMKWNPSTKYALAQRGYNVSSVVPEGEDIFLASANNLSQGGDSIDVLDEMHPSILQASVEAVKAVPGLAYCGVDFLLEDHRQPIDQQEAAICELNAQASVPVGEYPMFGPPRQMAKRFLLECVKEYDLQSTGRMDHLNLHLKVRGKVTNVGYREWFAKRANDFDCSGWIRNIGPRQVEVKVSGATPAVTALAAAAILGPRRALPTSVVTNHLTETVVGPFRIEESKEHA